MRKVHIVCALEGLLYIAIYYDTALCSRLQRPHVPMDGGSVHAATSD